MPSGKVSASQVETAVSKDVRPFASASPARSCKAPVEEKIWAGRVVAVRRSLARRRSLFWEATGSHVLWQGLHEYLKNVDKSDRPASDSGNVPWLYLH